MIRRRILLLSSLNSCKTRLLSDKPRNRKWNLPPIMPKSSVSNLSKTNPSTTTKKTADARDIRLAIGRPHAPSKNVSKTNPEHSKLERWTVQRLALKRKYPEGYHPFRKVSPDAIEGIRILHRQRPQFTVRQLADFFRVSPEAISRILKSKWRPSPGEREDREKRWTKHIQRIAEARTERKKFREQSTALYRHRNSVSLDPMNQSTRKHGKHLRVAEPQHLRRPYTRSRADRQGSVLKGKSPEKRGNRHSRR